MHLLLFLLQQASRHNNTHSISISILSLYSLISAPSGFFFPGQQTLSSLGSTNPRKSWAINKTKHDKLRSMFSRSIPFTCVIWVISNNVMPLDITTPQTNIHRLLSKLELSVRNRDLHFKRQYPNNEQEVSPKGLYRRREAKSHPDVRREDPLQCQVF